MMITMNKRRPNMTSEEKIVKIKEILNDTVGENYQRQLRRENESF